MIGEITYRFSTGGASPSQNASSAESILVAGSGVRRRGSRPGIAGGRSSIGCRGRRRRGTCIRRGDRIRWRCLASLLLLRSLDLPPACDIAVVLVERRGKGVPAGAVGNE